MGYLSDWHSIILYLIKYRGHLNQQIITNTFLLVHDKCISPISQPCELGLQWVGLVAQLWDPHAAVIQRGLE